MSKSTSKGAKPQILRKMGQFESFQTSFYVMELYCGTMIACRYSIPEHLRDPSTHSKLVDTLERAVADTISQHPLLQVGMVKEKSKRPAWAKIDSIDLAQHIEWRAVEGVEKYGGIRKDVIVRQLDTRFESLATRPGWRLVVLKLEYDNTLEVMFTWNHCNTDGTGGKIFHQTLLESLNNLKEKPDGPSLENHIWKTTVSAQTMMPPQNVIAKYKLTPGYTATTIWKELKPPVFAGKAEFASWGPFKLTPRETQIRTLSIDNDTLQKVLAVCRSHKTTLTGLLHGIAFVSLAPQLPEDQVAAMMGGTPLNLRRFIKANPPAYPWLEPNKIVGNFVTKMDHEFDKTLVVKVRDAARGAGTEAERFSALEGEVWSTAVTVRRELQDKLDLGLKNDAVGLMAVVGDWQKYQKDQMKKPRHGSWMVTNVGVIDGQPKGTSNGWSIQGSSFSLSANVLASMFSISTVAVKGGDLAVDVSWQDHIVDAGVGERLSVDLKSWLNHIGS
ncbi:alcohol acetyltransferase-domain-containing protein [Thelonectria olida]|uniref:Alcohol acetyltransferase-domain-containing protein n=1 Tax=Thelonectria olida TaxID=1576542 RepID=A0A9P8W4S9_9HYPO|nr:alcohol acetyltransferase-domain-containing protein [Thelonectria olida]